MSAIAAVQQNVAFKRELLSSDAVAVRSGILEMRGKALRCSYEVER